MSDEIIKVLDDLSQRFRIAVDWTSANMLPYLQMLTRKYVNYRLAMSVMELIVGILLFAAAPTQQAIPVNTQKSSLE